MSQQERIAKPQARDSKGRYTKAQETAHAEIPAERLPESEEILEYTDDLLDEIDGLLEEQEVLISYRQKGGE